MKTWRLISSHFYFLIGIVSLFLLLDMVATSFYACNRITWLEWTTKVPYPLIAIIDFVLLFGPPLWLGIKYNLCSQRNIFLYSMLFTLALGVISNIFSLLEWDILMKCMPEKYTYTGFQIKNIASWLVLPIGALLGGVMALTGYKWSKSNLDKKDRADKKQKRKSH